MRLKICQQSLLIHGETTNPKCRFILSLRLKICQLSLLLRCETPSPKCRLILLVRLKICRVSCWGVRPPTPNVDSFRRWGLKYANSLSCRGVRPPSPTQNVDSLWICQLSLLVRGKHPDSNPKSLLNVREIAFNGEAAVMEFWGMRNASSLPLLSGPL